MNAGCIQLVVAGCGITPAVFVWNDGIDNCGCGVGGILKRRADEEDGGKAKLFHNWYGNARESFFEI